MSIPFVANAQHNNITKNISITKNKINEQKFILINGINQWVTIKGDSSKHIILLK